MVTRKFIEIKIKQSSKIFTSFLFVFLLVASGLCVAADMPKTPVAVPSTGGLMKDEIIASDELKRLLDQKVSVLILDARGKATYHDTHIMGSKLPLSDEFYKQQELFNQKLISMQPNYEEALALNMKAYDKNLLIVTYCNTGCHASTTLLFKLKGLGFKNVKVMEEGMQGWEKKGYPVTHALEQNKALARH